MNWSQVRGNWNEVQSRFGRHWKKLSEDDLDDIGGDRDLLVDRLQMLYEMEQDEAEGEVDAFVKAIH